jgi:hypothetical protein
MATRPKHIPGAKIAAAATRFNKLRRVIRPMQMKPRYSIRDQQAKPTAAYDLRYQL